MRREESFSISVVIATRNRAVQLAQCLRSFSGLDTRPLTAWEIIVVDNGSSDSTAAVVEELRTTSDLPLRYLYEGTPGVSAARNAGILAARYPVLAFTDDDCLVESSWLVAIWRSFTEDPSVVLVGGRVDLFDPEDEAISIRRFDDRAEIRGIDDIFTRLIGCNVAISALALQTAGAFDTSIGPGTSFKAGEDHELFYRILKSGAKVVYEPDVRVAHAHGRRKRDEVLALKANYVKGRATILGKHIRAGDRGLIKQAYWELRAYLSARRQPDGLANAPEPRFAGIYLSGLVRSFLFLR